MNALTSASEMVFKFIQLFNCIVLVETTHLTQVECYMYIRMSFDGLECSTVGNLGSWANGIEWPEWPYRAEVPAVTVQFSYNSLAHSLFTIVINGRINDQPFPSDVVLYLTRFTHSAMCLKCQNRLPPISRPIKLLYAEANGSKASFSKQNKSPLFQ